MEDIFRIDSHKLMFHIDRVNAWLHGKQIFPLYLEIAPSGSCNHRCIFCAVDYLGYAPCFLDLNLLKNTVSQAANLGVKSIMYAGEGEPLLHPDICQIVKHTKSCGIDVAITTNGTLLNKDLAQKILKYLSWIRISLNAGTSRTYARIHRTEERDFYRALKNLQQAVSLKKKHRLTVSIGVQLLLIPENVKEVVVLAKKLKKIGLDYLTVKPYSQHPLSNSRVDLGFQYDHNAIYNQLSLLEDDRFKVSFRSQTMERLARTKDYKRCLATPFWSYIDAQGQVYACSAFLGKKEFSFGNINQNSFKKIMVSRRRRSVINRISSKINVNKCRPVCRLDKINSYLWELHNPQPHVNFI